MELVVELVVTLECDLAQKFSTMMVLGWGNGNNWLGDGDISFWLELSLLWRLGFGNSCCLWDAGGVSWSVILFVCFNLPTLTNPNQPQLTLASMFQTLMHD